ncbi:MAG: hypothetical protein ACYCYF_10075, partial [Anaerolineae bacterium]
MTEQNSERGPSSADRFLDMLLDALLERQRQRRDAALGGAAPATAPTARPDARRQAPGERPPVHPPTESAQTPATSAGVPPLRGPAAVPEVSRAARQEPDEARPSIGMDRLIRRMLIGLAVAVVLINIPVA